MNIFILLILFTTLLAIADSPDVCPNPMKRTKNGCAYFAGDLTQPKFDCNELKDKFGGMDCNKSAGSLCDIWAVKECLTVHKNCIAIGKKFSQKKISKDGENYKYCTNAYFTITDPDPVPFYRNTLQRDFYNSLFLYKVWNKQDEVLGTLNPMENLCPVCHNPGANMPLPDAYEKCLSRKDNIPHDWIPVSNRWGKLSQRYSKYRLHKKDGKFILATNIRFNYQGRPQDKQEVVDKLSAALRCAEKFFAKYKIVLELGISTDEKSWRDWWNADIRNINISKYTKHINSSNWALSHESGVQFRTFTEDELCGTVIHELGHRLRLPDRYEEDKWPEKISGVTSPNSIVADDKAIMHTGNYALNTAYFTPEDLALLTNSLCRYDQNPKQTGPVPSPGPTPTPKP